MPSKTHHSIFDEGKLIQGTTHDWLIVDDVTPPKAVPKKVAAKKVAKKKKPVVKELDSYTCPSCNVVHLEDSYYWSTGQHKQTCPQCDSPMCSCCSRWSTYASGSMCATCYEQLPNCESCGCDFPADWEFEHYCDNGDHYCCEDCYMNGNDGSCSAHSESEDNSSASHGTSDAPPWVYDNDDGPAVMWERPPDAIMQHWRHVWQIDRTISPMAAAADFYMLEAVVHNMDVGPVVDDELRLLAEMARRYRAGLVEYLDLVFREYTDMAIGGELRYHRAIGNEKVVRGNRSDAWVDWKYLRDQVGPRALKDAAFLFREMTDGGIGGEPWAVACDLLYMRVTNRITPEQWVDRVFTLVHNGGAFINKIAWGPNEAESGQELQLYIGPLHSATQRTFHMLRMFSSNKAGHIWDDWIVASNRNRQRFRISPWQREWQAPPGNIISNSDLGYGTTAITSMKAGKFTRAFRELPGWMWQAQPDVAKKLKKRFGDKWTESGDYKLGCMECAIAWQIELHQIKKSWDYPAVRYVESTSINRFLAKHGRWPTLGESLEFPAGTRTLRDKLKSTMGVNQQAKFDELFPVPAVYGPPEPIPDQQYKAVGFNTKGEEWPANTWVTDAPLEFAQPANHTLAYVQSTEADEHLAKIKKLLGNYESAIWADPEPENPEPF